MKNLVVFAFLCVGAVVIAEDLCNPGPCQNNGVCKVKKRKEYCTCPAPFGGQHCETNLCDPNPCQNNGECMVDGIKAKCKCQDPFTGKKCQKDKCEGKCLNGGTCDPSTLKCTCDSKYKGKSCEEKIPCAFEPCVNGGTCHEINKKPKFLCVCVWPYFGTYCQCHPDVSNPCHSSPCKNGGTCDGHRFGHIYECHCPVEYVGAFCETRIKVPCDDKPCKNNGVCKNTNVEKGQYKCACNNPWKGKTCELHSVLGACYSNPCTKGQKCIKKGGSKYKCVN